MTNIILNVSRQPEWIAAFKRAEAELGWNPVYWITYEQNHDQVGVEFPDATRHRRLEVNRGILHAGYRDLQQPLSADLIERAQPHVLTALEIIDRFDLGLSMSHNERIRTIHKLLGYWLGVIEAFSINMGVFSAPPHGLGNYLLYAALKLKEKLVRIFVWTSVENLTFVTSDIDGVPAAMTETYRTMASGKTPIKLSPNIAQAIRTVREADPTFKPWYVHDADSRENRRQAFLDDLERSIDKISTPSQFLPEQPISLRHSPFRKRRGEKGSKIVDRTFKVPGRPMTGQVITLQEYEDYRDWAMVQKIRLRERYDAMCTPADKLEKPFVYFGLHYQPERTTCPDGGVFSDQYLCASILSHGIPSDWEVVIKEHPHQFRYTSMGEAGRWDGYYDDFLALGNVRFVSTDTSSIALLDRSRAVATITGAVGWESLIRGKPTLYFGFAWYGICNGAHQIREAEDVRNALARVPNNAATERDVDAFAATLELHGRPVITTPTLRGAIESTDGMADHFFDLLTTCGSVHK